MKVMSIRCLTATVTMLAAAMALAGCEETVDVTQRPAARTANADPRPAITEVIVAERIDIGGLGETLGQAFSGRLAQLTRTVERAWCVPDAANRKRCQDVKLTAEIALDGRPRLLTEGEQLTVEVPIIVALDVRNYGKPRRQLLQNETKLAVRVPIQASIDESWKLTIGAGADLAWPHSPILEVLEGHVNIGQEVARGVRARMPKFIEALSDLLQPAQLKAMTGLTWRHLHYPLQLSERPDLWLRGDPMAVRFAGLRANDDTIDVRAAILTQLSGVIGARPLPLMPRPIPYLTFGEPGSKSGGLVLPVIVDYEQVKRAFAAQLPQQTLLPTDPQMPGRLMMRDLDVYASGNRLVLDVSLDAELPDLWRRVVARAALLGELVAGESEPILRLDKVDLAPTAPLRSYARPAAEMLRDRKVIAAIIEPLAVDVSSQTAALLALANETVNLTFSDGLHLKGRFDAARIRSVLPTQDGLQVGVELIGEIGVHMDRPELASERTQIKSSTP